MSVNQDSSLGLSNMSISSSVPISDFSQACKSIEHAMFGLSIPTGSATTQSRLELFFGLSTATDSLSASVDRVIMAIELSAPTMAGPFALETATCFQKLIETLRDPRVVSLVSSSVQRVGLAIFALMPAASSRLSNLGEDPLPFTTAKVHVKEALNSFRSSYAPLKDSVPTSNSIPSNSMWQTSLDLDQPEKRVSLGLLGSNSSSTSSSPFASGAPSMSSGTVTSSRGTASTGTSSSGTSSTVDSSPSPSHQQVEMNEVKILGKLGRGSFGDVFKGDWRGTEVAIKSVSVASTAKGDIMDSAVLRELSIMQTMRHPNLVSLLGYSIGDNEVKIVMEYMSGGSLDRQLLNPNVKLHWRKVQKMAIDVAKGVNFLHLSNPPVIHRDLKSLNLLVDENDVVKVCDFGLSRYSGNSATMTHGTGSLVWMAPEMMRHQTYGPSVDVFSFGVIMSELCSRSVPYEGSNAAADLLSFAWGVVDGSLRPSYPPSTPSNWVSLMQRCWSSNPADRPDFDTILNELRSMSLPLDEELIRTNVSASAVWPSGSSSSSNPSSLGSNPFSSGSLVSSNPGGKSTSHDASILANGPQSSNSKSVSIGPSSSSPAISSPSSSSPQLATPHPAAGTSTSIDLDVAIRQVAIQRLSLDFPDSQVAYRIFDDTASKSDSGPVDVLVTSRITYLCCIQPSIAKQDLSDLIRIGKLVKSSFTTPLACLIMTFNVNSQVLEIAARYKFKVITLAIPTSFSLQRVIATKDYHSKHDWDLSFKSGESIVLIAEDASGWWKGKVKGNKIGFFPSSLVRF